jgi:hypothetical protein
MEVRSALVQFRNYRKATSKKTGDQHCYVDLLDEAGELSLNCDNISFEKVHLMRPYSMVAEIQFRRIGMSQLATLINLAVSPAVFEDDEVDRKKK